MKSFLFIIIAMSGFISCSDNQNDLDLSSSINSNVILQLNKNVFDKIDNNRKNNISEGDNYTIKKSKREGDNLQLVLEYSGGYKVHAFEIIWDGIVYTDDPCKINLLLIHRGNFDNCEALITDTINIDLKELIGDIPYKNDCSYHVFNSYNFSENPDIIIVAVN